MMDPQIAQMQLIIAILGRHCGRLRVTQKEIDRVMEEGKMGYQVAHRQTPDGAHVFEYKREAPPLVVEPTDVQAQMADVMRGGPAT